MRCDYCETTLPEDHVMKVDASGRPVEAICRRCDLEFMRERAQRLGLTARDLTDEFERHLRKQGLPERIH